MKRSKQITLTLLTGATLVVSGCEQKEQTRFFADKAACMQTLNDNAACEEAEKQALVQHLQNAPKFTTKEECESQFGADNCVQPEKPAGQGEHLQQGGGSYFMPMMMGYMMGRMMGGGGIFGGSRYAAEPLYKDRYGNAYTRNRGLAGMFNGNRFESMKKSSVPNGAYKPYSGQASSEEERNNSSYTRRGGFGTSSRSVWS